MKNYNNREKFLEAVATTLTESEATITGRQLYDLLKEMKQQSRQLGLGKLAQFCSQQLAVPLPMNEQVIDNRLRRVYEQLQEALQEIQQNEERQKTALDDAFILLIHSDITVATQLKEVLAPTAAEVSVALTAKQGLERFFATRPTCVMIEVDLPDADGFHVLKQLADVAASQHIPILMMAPEDTAELRIQTYENGALDFMVTPFHPLILSAYLQNRHRYRETIETSVVMDSLTGVGNRRHFDEIAAHYAQLHETLGTDFSLVMVDLDKFKEVNDTYGHLAGDEVLRTFGKIARTEKRESDYVFRYGGEEFAFILPGATAEKAKRLIDRIRARFNLQNFVSSTGSFFVQFSAGIAMFKGTVQELIATADQALYVAKSTGGNQTILSKQLLEPYTRKMKIHCIREGEEIPFAFQQLLNDTVSKLEHLDVLSYSSYESFLVSDWYNEEDAHILLMKEQAGGREGLACIKQVQREGRHTSNLAFVCLLEDSDEAYIAQLVQAGVDDYICAPFRIMDVFKRVEHVLKQFIV